MAGGTDYLREAWAKMHNIIVMPLSFIFNMGFSSEVPMGAAADAAFLLKVLGGNAAISAIQSINISGKSVGIAIEALAAEILFLTGNFWYYKFLINPQNLTMTFQKLVNEEESSDMTIINTFRNKATTMAFSGVSGSTLPLTFMSAFNQETKLPSETEARYPKVSATWIKFRQLEKFYNEINGDVVVLYDMDLYVGKLISFNFSLDADNPWVINYDLQLRIYPGMILHTLSVYDYKPFFNAMQERYGRVFDEKFEGKSAYWSGF